MRKTRRGKKKKVNVQNIFKRKYECPHRKIEEVISYRTNYPFGKNGGSTRGEPRSILKICVECKKRWKRYLVR